jgi:rfaE bifunctional protein kinase chain/domain
MTPPLTVARAKEILSRASSLRLVVVGDVFLDRYVVGRAERLSREGPVPVLSFIRQRSLPGGAANPANNLARLGAEVVQVGVVGDDAPAEELRALLVDEGIRPDGLVVDASRPTSVKTRIVAEGFATPQQVARIDDQSRLDVCGAVQDRLLGALREAAAGADAVLVSHYKCGVVTDDVCDAARDVTDDDHWLTVDAQGDLSRFRGFDLVRVGGQDASTTLGSDLTTEDDYEHVVFEILGRLDARVVMVGRGADGMSIGEAGRYAHVPPNNAHEVFDVTGAGDTVIAVTTAALAAGASVDDAVALANLAAGIVVRRLGVAAPTIEEILTEIGVRGSG